MDSAYLGRNAREQEMTTHISLARLDPTALIELRAAGKCQIQIPEAVFDLEHPGQYFRRIKALSVTVPCVVGAYGSVPLKLTQISNRIRVDAGRRSNASDLESVRGGSGRERHTLPLQRWWGTVGSTERWRDAGVFNLTLDDERYLPFEGSGVIGTYGMELPGVLDKHDLLPLRTFDYETISDVVLHFRYTARDGGSALRPLAAGTLRERLNKLAPQTGGTGLFQAIDLRRDKPNVWNHLTAKGSATLKISDEDLPYFASSHAAIHGTHIVARVDGAPASLAMTVGGNGVTLQSPVEGLPGLLRGTADGVGLGTPVELTAPLTPRLRDMIFIVNYTLTV
jgi:hypothetical protein